VVTRAPQRTSFVRSVTTMSRAFSRRGARRRLPAYTSYRQPLVTGQSRFACSVGCAANASNSFGRTASTLCADVRSQAARWAADHFIDLQACDPGVPVQLDDRAADCWRPLLAIAEAAGSAWLTRAIAAARALSAHRSNEDYDLSSLLLLDTRDIFLRAGDPNEMFAETLIEGLLGLDDRPWSEFSKGQPLAKTKMAALLKEFGVMPAGTIRVDRKTAKGYRREAFVDAWTRYLPRPGSVKASHRNQPNVSGPESTISNRHTSTDSDGSENDKKTMDAEGCYGVTVQDGEQEDQWKVR
jgi:hypothetical protein